MGTHHDLLVFGDSLIILVVVLRGAVDVDAMVFQVPQDALLECSCLVFRKGVCFCDDWYQVDFAAESLHVFDIEGFQTVSRGLDEVQAGVYAVVDELAAIDTALLVEVGVEAGLDVVEYRLPCLAVVDKVAKARSVDDSQFQPDSALLDVCGDGLDVDGLWPLGRRVEHGLGRVQGSVEECIDECRLAQPGFAFIFNGGCVSICE